MNISKDTYNNPTKYHCYHCCHPFGNIPLGMPVHYIDESKTFEVFGIFCSYNCMKAYAIYDTDKTKFNKCALIKMMYFNNTTNINTINTAPPRCCLQIFGGDMSIEEFRENQDVIMRHAYPLIPMNPNIEKRVNVSCVKTEDASKSFSETKIFKNEPLKLKRKNNKNNGTLEQFMDVLIQQ